MEVSGYILQVRVTHDFNLWLPKKFPPLNLAVVPMSLFPTLRIAWYFKELWGHD